jgi:exodeoxyribonuclease III
LRDEAAGWLAADPAAQVALVGDWNIAPTDDDIWRIEASQRSTHVSEPERTAFTARNAEAKARATTLPSSSILADFRNLGL